MPKSDDQTTKTRNNQSLRIKAQEMAAKALQRSKEIRDRIEAGVPTRNETETGQLQPNKAVIEAAVKGNATVGLALLLGQSVLNRENQQVAEPAQQPKGSMGSIEPSQPKRP